MHICAAKGGSVKLSTKCRYAARAMMEIGRNYGKGPKKRKNIAELQAVSDSYLENILIVLKSAGLIETIRGARGGYVLTRAPDQITMLDIISALEGSLAPVECLDKPEICDRVGSCPTREVWVKLLKVQKKVLRESTVQDLLERERNMQSPDYVI